jgi:hypothetical protein
MRIERRRKRRRTRRRRRRPEMNGWWKYGSNEY